MEDFSKDIAKFVEAAAQKAKELGGVAKLYALIKAEEAKKQEQYYRLGKKYYQLFKDAPEKDLAGYVDKLKACDEKIAEYKEELKKEESEDDGEGYTEVVPREVVPKEAEIK